jgi:putative endonuclease
MRSRNHCDTGKTGEDLACAELRRRGYAILARRYRTRHGELDIVARDGATVVFVEVKARATMRFGAPSEAVTPWKQRRIQAMAADYLLRCRLTRLPCRFDVVTVLEPDGPSPTVEVIAGAFAAGA